MCVFLLPGRLSLQFCMAFQATSSLSARLCWRHPDLRVLSSVWGWDAPATTVYLRRRSGALDDVKSAAAHHSKTEVLWCASSRRQHQLPTGPVRIGNTSVMPVIAVRDLGVHLDTDLTMTAHVTATVRACFSALRQIRSVKNSLTRDALLTLIGALVVSKLDYCSSVLAGLPGSLMRRLQSVLNSAARLRDIRRWLHGEL